MIEEDDEVEQAEPRAIMLFEAWAELSAARPQLAPGQLEEFVGREGLTMVCWAASDERWLKELAFDLRADDYRRIDRYAALVEQALSSPIAPAAVTPSPVTILEEERGTPKSAPGSRTEPEAALPNSGAGWRELEGAPNVLDHLESTLEAMLGGSATLPFGITATPEFKSWLERVDSEPASAEARHPEQTDDPDLDGTALGFSMMPKPALPFSARSPSMPLELYASLSAALATFPERAPEILSRFHLNGADDKRQVDAIWSEIFARSPQEHARWQELVSRFCTAMSGKG